MRTQEISTALNRLRTTVEIGAAAARQKPDAGQSPHAVGVGSKCVAYFLLNQLIFAQTAESVTMSGNWMT